MSDVTDQLTKRGMPHEVISHEQAYTSTDEALALGISADELVKTIVLDTGSRHALAVIPGSRRLDIRAADGRWATNTSAWRPRRRSRRTSPVTS